MTLDPVIEAAALRQTEDALREMMTAAKNCGMSKASIALMLRSLADEMDPPATITMQ